MAARPLRLAFARVNQETNALSPVLTTLADFQSTHWLEGPQLLAACGRKPMEVLGMFRNAELSGFVQEIHKLGGAEVAVVPLVSAWAVPGGPLTVECLQGIIDAILAQLRAAEPVDGLYLSLHGAMGVRGVGDPEGEILRQIREEVGVDLPIVVTYDLHASVTRAVIAQVQALVAYATNPHRDHARTGRMAAKLLLGICQKTLQPTMAWRSLPMLLGGGVTIDFLPPMLAIFQRLRLWERQGKILSGSVLMCHPWNAQPETGWNVLIVTDNDRALAERLADEVAELCWNVRNDQPPTFHTPEDAIARAKKARLARKLGVVVLADASDVVSAGAPGENTALIQALLTHGPELVSYVPLRDPALVAQLWPERVGSEHAVTIGAKLDALHGKPLDMQVKIHGKHESHGVGRIVVLVQQNVHIVVVEGPALAVRPAFFANAGLNPWRADVIVVKNFFPFRMFFAVMARLTLYVRTHGVTDFDAAYGLEFAGAIHPRDVVTEWRSTDQRRRLA
jgi:microcystin degradation protein MlrC